LDGSEYQIDDLYDDQKFVVSTVMSKLYKWLNCDDLSQFKPLRLTINGAGGCGKSVIINTIVTVIRKMFNCNDVVKVCAPTGTAAHNVGGTTLHHLSKMGVDNHDYVPKAMTATRQKMLVRDFKSLLAVIIDKRSLLASKDLGTTETVIGETIHSGGILNHLSFGGLPILILVGDDYQLPSTGSGATDSLTCAINSKTMVGRGRKIFLDCAKHVIELNLQRELQKIAFQTERLSRK